MGIVSVRVNNVPSSELCPPMHVLPNAEVSRMARVKVYKLSENFVCQENVRFIVSQVCVSCKATPNNLLVSKGTYLPTYKCLNPRR